MFSTNITGVLHLDFSNFIILQFQLNQRQRREMFVADQTYQLFRGAAHRNISQNEYYGAMHLLICFVAFFLSIPIAIGIGATHLIHFYPQIKFLFFIESHRKNLIQFLQP